MNSNVKTCIKCGNPLRIVKGGNKTDVGSNNIVMVHVWGCLNPDCSIKMQEQSRDETIVPSFTE